MSSTTPKVTAEGQIFWSSTATKERNNEHEEKLRPPKWYVPKIVASKKYTCNMVADPPHIVSFSYQEVLAANKKGALDHIMKSRSWEKRMEKLLRNFLVLMIGAGFGYIVGVKFPLVTHPVVKPPIAPLNYVKGVYFTNSVENLLPQGFTNNTLWRHRAENSTVTELSEGCGRMQNRLATFDDGSKACVRYRQNTDQIQGEIFSYYLGQELGLKNLLPTTLDVVKTHSRRWANVLPAMQLAQWLEDRPIVLTQYLPQLLSAYIPNNLRNNSRRFHPPDVNNKTDVVNLAQWSDLIIFDYLTANLDRVVNNLYNLQWNDAMMNAPAHNLGQAGSFLVFLDNESGLLHGYRLLFKYETHHSTLLDALCVFRKSTADAIIRLYKDRSIGEKLRNRFRDEHPDLVDVLPELPEKSVNTLNKRLGRVYDVINRCEALYPLG